MRKIIQLPTLEKLTPSEGSTDGSIKDYREQTSFSLDQRLRLIGCITHLMINSPLHRQYQIMSLAERFIPSLIHNQFRYYEIKGNPIGFVNWAWLTDEVEQKFITGQYVLQFEEWQGGPNLWFPEFLAPFGHARFIVKDLRSHILPKGTPAKSLRVRADGTLRGVSRWKV